MTKPRTTAIGGEAPTNGAAETLALSAPYVANVRLQGICDLLFHRYNCEEVEAKGAAGKGTKAKKTDNLESYVYRDDQGQLCLPGEYVRQAIIHAAKFRQDPRSPRKSAMDLFKAAVVCLTPLASLGREKWDYEDKRRVVIQRSAITRVRPAIKTGWTADFQIMCNLPEYIRPNDLHDSLSAAGRLIGLADFRPTYGRFSVVAFDIGFEK